MHLIRDISDSSSYWGAAWVFGCFPDVHVLCDAPIGCYNLLGVAVTNYTDARTHMKNLTPTSIREEDVINDSGATAAGVGAAGTATRRTRPPWCVVDRRFL